MGHDVRGETDIDLVSDIRRVLRLLPEPDRELCAGLASRTVTALARSGHGSRSALYRRIGDLRCVFAAHGLGPEWDGSVVA
jgi:RNA polymerase sigma-70 factor (ECF subfamily)